MRFTLDAQNPHSWQDFCVKGRNAAQLVEHPRRILTPMRQQADGYVESTLDEAISDIAARIAALIDADRKRTGRCPQCTCSNEMICSR